MYRLIYLLLAASSLQAQQLPAGYPSRDPNLDVLPGFRTPPPGYGEVSFYWWLGDPLTKDRLTWQLEQLKNKGISGLQVNYAHSDKGGRSYGLTIPSDPPLFSTPWWDLFTWFLKQARQRGMAASLSDYTLGWAGNGWYIDEILKDHPEIHGAALLRESHDCAGDCTWKPAHEPLTLHAFRLENRKLVPSSATDLRPHLQSGTLRWTAPTGQWRIVSVYANDVPVSLDPMHPLSGTQMIEKFFQRFEDRNPGESGKGLNFFFSDELSFGIRGWLWNKAFAEEFRKRKGYDVTPELASLFEETGPRAAKVRLDYSDVMVALSEANYFRPLYEWHHARGMLYGCDHGGRGRDVTEFGDYFRTQRWMTGPGNDQPGLASDVIKNKVSSSITHLYERERTWLEGYYGSGWGTTSAQVVDATWRNFAQGQNLLTLHGLYYSTHGGWWEWAPPCNHFRMPYWNHMGEFLHTVERMSYLLSQGRHRADVAIVYPVAAMEAGMSGKESVDTAFNLGRHLYGQAVDFDFMDFESLARAKVQGNTLQVAGEQYRVLVLPAMRAVRHSTLEKALEFHKAGGKVIILGAPPQASDRTGDGDPEVLAMAKQLPRLSTNEEVTATIATAFPRDFVCKTATQPSILHRKAGEREVYFVYGAAKDTECSFRATGKVELWDPWTGNTTPQSAISQSTETTTLRMPLESTEAQMIVFTPGRAEIASPRTTNTATVIPVEGPWQFELKPTLDNRYGDYRLPVAAQFIGAEARHFRYSEDQRQWRDVTYSYGPRFWKTGPLPATAETANPPLPENKTAWKPYEYSTRWGIEGDPGHQGYHGLKSELPNDTIALGKLQTKSTTTAYTEEPGGTRYFLATSVIAPRAMQARILAAGDLPAAAWLGGQPLPPNATTVSLKEGPNALVLRYDKPGRGYFLLADPTSPQDWTQTYPLSSAWYNRPGLLPFDTRSQDQHPAGWYRTTSPPGLRSMKIVALGKLSLQINGKSAVLRPTRTANEYEIRLATPLADPAQLELKIEQERGYYGGAALLEPVTFDCVPGTIPTGDWSEIEGLSSYSGGARYSKTITLTAAQTRNPIQLDLGTVSASAEVTINGKPAGIKLAPPYRMDISKLVKPGPNKIEVLVYSALSNHYQTIPTRYRKPSPSGLLGPVRLVILKKVVAE